MKAKISVTLDEETVLKVLKKLRDDRFRNKSHVIEYAIEKFLENGRS